MLWPLRCSYLVCQVCRWFTAPRPAQTRTRSPEHAVPPADNSTGFCACTLYLVFKEPTPTEPETRSRWHSPPLTSGPCGPFLGEPFKVTTEDLYCQSLKGKKNCSGISLRSNHRPRAGFRRPNDPVFNSIHAPGVGSEPFRLFDFSGYWLSRLCRPPNPARAI